MTTDLERRLRALRDALPEPPVTIDPAALDRTGVEVLTEPAPSRPRRTRWAVSVLVAAALVVGVVVAVQVVRGGPPGDRSTPVGVVTPIPTATSPAELVVRDGDRVTGTGEVYAVPGQPVRFCAPAPVALSGGGSGAAPSPLNECPSGVTVTGVDLAALTGRETVGDAVRGTATLVGVYAGGTLAVQSQSPSVPPAPPGPGYSDDPPCPAPAGGWPQGQADANIDTGPLDAFQAAHQDEVVGIATLRPSSTQAVAYLLTSGDAAAAADELRTHYGPALCVAHTDVTPAQLRAARSAFTALMPPGDSPADIYTVSDYTITPPPAIGVGCVLVTPDVAARAAAFPGLVQFDPWLSPVA